MCSSFCVRTKHSDMAFRMLSLIVLLIGYIHLCGHTASSTVYRMSSHAATFNQRPSVSREKRESLSQSISCIRTQAVIDDRLGQMDAQKRKSFAEEIEFTGDNKFSLQMAWTGNDTERIFVVTSEDGTSTCYLSDSFGRHFNNISSKLADATTNTELTLQKHPIDPKVIYLVASSLLRSSSSLFITCDAGNTFQKASLPLYVSGSLVFHPSKPDLLMAVDFETQDLYISKDKGYNWSKAKSNVVTFKWSSAQDSDDLYVITGNGYFSIYSDSPNNVLEKSSDLGQTWTKLYDHVYTFGVGGKFLYASVYVAELASDQRKLVVSTDGGMTWNHAHLPTITPDMFYSILDSSEEQIFIHVDDPGNTGKGTLYLSDATGIIFAKSLENHLYPNYEDLTDFYAVQSMRGVYIASQLLSDNSIHTVISYNRGGEWQPVKRPAGMPCTDETKSCNLHIHNLYSIKRGVRASLPLSVPNAVGIILVHGHVAESLQTTDPDVYISSDGGYTWKFALKGPHHYQIADHGGLLVAIPADTETPSLIKFSTDEGSCWITYNYTQDKEPIQFTGLLVEPGNKKMTAAIWGYTEERIWHTYIINFTQLIDAQCRSSDYEDWVAHIHNGDEGCLLGNKETFKRLKQDSWCFNGEAYSITKNVTPCLCTPDDYDCDYGYVREFGTEKCTRDTKIEVEQIDICKRGHRERFIPLGYHKIPGDACQGGFIPPEAKIIDLSQMCKDDTDFGQSDIHNTLNLEHQPEHPKRGVIIALVVICCIIGITIVTTVLSRRFLNRSRSYHYMSIKADDGHMNSTNTSLYEESSDEVMVH